MATALVVESEHATVTRLSADFLGPKLADDPPLCSALFCNLALEQARQIYRRDISPRYIAEMYSRDVSPRDISPRYIAEIARSYRRTTQAARLRALTSADDSIEVGIP